jgi:predicted CxxxxCH...CXXCH cytochrome family protein
MSDGKAFERLGRAGFLVALAGAALAGALPAGCLERPDALGRSRESTECTACHGDPRRPGSALRRAAPPADLLGASDPRYPGVGAHALHLDASSTHAGFACDECHVVPEHTESKGHADHAPPATITFGILATHGGRHPSYDPVARTCGDTYCHRGAGAVWTEARSSAEACGTCHGLPPPLPHPQSDRCSVCHGDVIDAERRMVRPELHVDGTVEYTPGSCTACHGSGDQPAPPKDTHGNASPSVIGVGAHAAHLSGGAASRALACTECHVVPGAVEDPGHIQGLPARVVLTGIAATGGRTPAWNHLTATCSNTFCHGPSEAPNVSPLWTAPGPLACTACHGTPPPPPHPQMQRCSICHGAVVGSDDRTIVDRSRHVNGVVDVAVPVSCTACHGQGTDPTPIPGQPGAGAHRTHVTGAGAARPVPCGECHTVPATVLEHGHIDTGLPPAVVFSGAATAGTAAPTYENGTCRNTECHGGSMPDGYASGGSNTAPDWTVVDGSEDACGTCHGLPPPPPHPYGTLNPKCSACHGDIASDNRTFTRPDLHVDGVVTFTVP